VLETHHLRLLQLAAECWDRAQAARRVIQQDGPFTTNRYGATVAHPALRFERDARANFAKLLR
jgi:hypothetical protein